MDIFSSHVTFLAPLTLGYLPGTPIIMVLMNVRSVPPSFALVAGPVLVALCLNWFLLGVLFIQVYLYHVSFPNDRVFFKCLVYFVFLLDCLQTVMFMVQMFDYFVYGWGDISTWTKFGLIWFSIVVLDGIIAGIVQMTFAWRLWVLAMSRVLTGVVGTLAMFQLVASLVNAAKFKSLSSIANQHEANTTGIVWLAGNVAVDVIIAISMTMFLFRSRRSVMKHTVVVVDRLILLTLETGTVTASVSIVCIILFFVFPDNLMYTCSVVILGKLYSNTLLVIFNNRALMTKEQPETQITTGGLQSNLFDSNIEHRNVRVELCDESATVAGSMPMHDIQKSSLDSINRV